jgi:hypothetical protein
MNGNDIEHARTASSRPLSPAAESNTPKPKTAPESSLAAESSEGASIARTRRLESRRPPLSERMTELAIRILAYSAVAAMILILIFIAKEAWPILTSTAIHREVTLAKMWFIQQWPGYDAPEHVWQPCPRSPSTAFGPWSSEPSRSP